MSIPSLKGKHILIGVTAGIAAYKIPHLVRLLVKEQASVKVIMTEDAEAFVTPLTLSVLSKEKVYTAFASQEHEWHSHVALAQWADVFVIAPATANTLAKMSHGICDNLLLATYLSAKCPVFFAPAMDLDMYAHPTTKNNIVLLQSFGNHLIPCEFGELASGLVGEGRMAEPERIVAQLAQFFFPKKALLKGKKLLITAGPTYEMIDPVRFVGNLAARMGGEVTLILGPTAPHTIESSVKVCPVVSAQQMYEAAQEAFAHTDIAILAAAVADYKPMEQAPQKIKKKTDQLTLELTKTQDILASLGAQKDKQLLIGFALETENELENAKGKLTRKHLDAIVLNSLNDKGAGFSVDTNQVTFITREDKVVPIPLKTKTEIAADILTLIHDELL